MSNRGYSIPRDRNDEALLMSASSKVFEDIKNEYLFQLPNNWNIECSSPRLFFSDIKSSLLRNGCSLSIAESYYGGNNSIITDAHIIYLTIKDGDIVNKYPLFMGEMKKQGTNNKRIKEGKGKQAQGNAAGDRVAKNYLIASDYCYACDSDFFPYNVFLHGFDFSNSEITTTTKSKLTPLFGSLNVFNPWFDKDALILLSSHKGGSCFYQEDEFTEDWLMKICYSCCVEGIKHYLKKYNV
jgi:hypothetical protein